MLTFLFADLSGFTAMTESHGDEDAAAVALRFADLARASLAPGATLVKTIGDEVMIVAEAAPAAVRTALALASTVRREAGFLALRAGLHRGTAVARGADYFGAAVNVAARVAARAHGGQILCTEAVRSAGGELLEARFLPAGEAHLKNVSVPVTLFEIVAAGDAPASAEIDPVCRMCVDPALAPARLCHDGATYHFCGLSCAKAFLEHPERYGRE